MEDTGEQWLPVPYNSPFPRSFKLYVAFTALQLLLHVRQEVCAKQYVDLLRPFLLYHVPASQSHVIGQINDDEYAAFFCRFIY